ncbi:MAG TPA: methylenetetrahydrofolate reductase [NAD(P)H] [Mycobacteriales bacterium]
MTASLQQAPSVADLLTAGGPPVFSYEFFPPKTDQGEANLWLALRQIEALRPAFVSVTYGAGGSTRDRTVGITGRIATETTLTPVAHLTAVNHSVAELRRLVGTYAGASVRNILVLRGDPPGDPQGEWVRHPEGFSYASEVVELAAGLGDFCIGVAAFPERYFRSASLEEDAQTLLRKAEAGASYAITQFFFDPADYFRLRDRMAALHCELPIQPGVMPITNVRQIERMAQLSGATFPGWLADRLRAADSDGTVAQIGIEVATDMSRTLLDGGAPGVHLITMNRSASVAAVHANLTG